MKSIILMSTLCAMISSYKMDSLVTCLEQNDESPYGFKESLTWGNWESDECKEYPDLCEKYEKDLPFPGRGDVCDHIDPISGKTRNACKMTTMFGAAIDEEKTWSWKCVEKSTFVLKDEEGEPLCGAPGTCLINTKRIMCCCEGDYCTADPVYAEYAKFGNPEYFPIDFDAVMAIDPGDIKIVVTVPGYEDKSTCSGHEEEEGDSSEEKGESSSSKAAEEEESSSEEEAEKEESSSEEEAEKEESSSEEEEEESGDDYSTQYMYAKSPFKNAPYDNAAHSSPGNSEYSQYVMLISTYSVIGVICLTIGLFVGITFNNKRITQKNDFARNDF